MIATMNDLVDSSMTFVAVVAGVVLIAFCGLRNLRMARPAHRPVACPKARVNPVRPYNSRRALRRRLLARISVRPNILTSIGCAVAIVGTTTLAQDVYVTLCRVRFVVTDAQARIVPHLGPDDLVVLDNNIPQQLAEFHERSNA